MVSNPSSNGLELVWMDPYELAENPLNFRAHPQAQRRSLHAALQSLGWLQPLLYNRTTNRLIDGHLRRQEAIESGITQVPVFVVELTEEQERAALASIDYHHGPGRGQGPGLRQPPPQSQSTWKTTW